MLEITDINTLADDVGEVNRLKEEFRTLLSPTVTNGQVFFVSGLPAFGNLLTKIKYLIFIYIKKEQGNYYRIKVNNTYCYLDNAVIIIDRYEDDTIIKVDRQFIYTDHGAFDYQQHLAIIRRDLDQYWTPAQGVKSFAMLQLIAAHAPVYDSPSMLCNKQLSAMAMLTLIARQSYQRNPDSRIHSFATTFFAPGAPDLPDIVRDFVRKINEETQQGILTKTKLDRITRTVKLVDEVYENAQQSISIITGKAGTGKTLVLMRIMFRHLTGSHNLRFLTFNNLLAFDIKMNMRAFGIVDDRRLSIQTIHQFMFRIAQRLGVALMLYESRVNELLEICAIKVRKLSDAYVKFTTARFFNKNAFLQYIPANYGDEIDRQEFRSFANFLATRNEFGGFDAMLSAYLLKKRETLVHKVSGDSFLSDYYNVLQNIHFAVTDPAKFYEEMGIRNRYELLSVLYQMDASDTPDEEIITFEVFAEQLKSVRNLTNWSSLIVVDEAQDCHVLEKEIIFAFRQSRHCIVATGGKEQLIRQAKLLHWNLSQSKPIPHKIFPLRSGSYRQKANIVHFVNTFAKSFGFDLQLQSVAESKGLGKVIIDTRSMDSWLPAEMANDLKNNGHINGCTPYESLLLLIPSRNYTTKKMADTYVIDETDFFTETKQSTNRKIAGLDQLEKLGFECWSGVAEEKSKLKMPNQNETRVIHYESCRGLESWSVACMSIDDYFAFKQTSQEASGHLSEDLYLTEDERRQKYAALWCLMAFTRPIDTLYLHIRSKDSWLFSRLKEIQKQCPAMIIN